MYELLEGDDSVGQEFHGIDQPLMLKILAYMERQGNAKLFTGSDPAKMGVKVGDVDMNAARHSRHTRTLTDLQGLM